MRKDACQVPERKEEEKINFLKGTERERLPAMKAWGERLYNVHTVTVCP
jgi:hypothetical protein